MSRSPAMRGGDGDLKWKVASASMGGGDREASAFPEGDNLEGKDGEAKARLLRMLGMGPAVEEAVAGAGAGKKKKLVKKRMTKAFMEHLIAFPCNPIPVIPEEKLAKRSQEFREIYAEKKAIADRIFEYDQGLIQQYLTKGYAEEEFEVTDDEN